MIQIEQIEGVYKFRMARTLFGRGLYFTTAYWVDGMLIDTGCAHTVQEFVRSLEGLPLKLIINTHSHEDHIAANALLKSRYQVEPLAHPLALPVMASPKKMQPLHP
jgi:hydroxyacylglutathione hydrolase